MFEFLRRTAVRSKKPATLVGTEEEKVLEALRLSLASESLKDTTLKNRVRIIDLEDKVTKIEKIIKNLQASFLPTRRYAKRNPRVGMKITHSKQKVQICAKK
jgi:hypothetical protein